MPKSARRKYYAVRVGREGPKVYETWPECHANVSRWPGAIYKSFLSREEAVEFAAIPTGKPIPSVESLHLGRASASGPTGVDDPEALFIPLSPTQTPPPLSPSPAIILSPEQQKVLTKVERGENVFFTGSAGTGKSVLLREIIRVRGGRGNV
ncbi:hypothetical protein J3A83DRAFT_3524499 [Scleroderma citrinum]